MKNLNLISIALTCSALVPLAAAQSETGTTEPKKVTTKDGRAPDHVLLDDIIDAKVGIIAGAEARRDAAEDNKTAKPETGEIDDLILDQQSGRIEAAVVSFGGFIGIGDKTVALPIGLLAWNPTTKRYDAAVDIDQLKSLPAFDIEAAHKNGIDRELMNLRSAWMKANVKDAHGEHGHSATEASDKKDKDSKDAGLAATPIRCVVASKIDDLQVHANNGTDKFGKISKTIIDRNACRLDYYVVSHGGALGVGDTEYLVPREAMPLCQKGTETYYCLNRTAEEMKASGVRYEKPKTGVVDEVAAQRSRQQIERK